MTKRLILALLIGAFSWFALALPAGGLAAEGLVVIVNPANPIGTIEVQELRALYLKEKKTWPSGVKVVSLDRNIGSPERVLFLEKVVGQSAASNEMHWIALKQTTGDYPPQRIGTDRLMILMVMSIEGAVGYVSESSLDPQARTKVKVLQVVGEEN